MTGHAVEFRRRRAGSAIAVFLLGSLAAHAAVLVSLPGFERKGGLRNAVVLEVVLLRAIPLAADPREPAARQTPDQTQPERIPAEAMREIKDVRRAPVLALPEPRESQSSSFTVEPARIPVPSVTAPAPLEAAVATQPASIIAAYLRNPSPRYPEVARRSGEQGTVTLRVRVARDGAASHVAVEKSSGSPHLDTAALEAVKAWRFTPARRGGDAVESWMLVPIVFRLDGAS